MLPAITIKLRIKMLLCGPANTEISDEGPCLWYVEYSTYDFRLEDRNPAKPKSLGVSSMSAWLLWATAAKECGAALTRLTRTAPRK